MIEGALALEGGSLRCLFTAGVLDVLMEHKIELSYVIGVSAGSLSGLNYVSKQIGRTAKVNLDYVNDPRYLGFRNMIKKPHSIFNFDFLFGDITQYLIPFDFSTFQQSSQKFIAVITNCETGEAEYIGKDDIDDIMKVARASCSMPMLSQKVEINGQYYLDGGIAMPIPYQKAIEDGNKKIVVVLTREAGYQKHEDGKAMGRAYQKVYRSFPNLVKRLENIPSHYNQMQEEMDRLEQEGKIFIIRPKDPVLVSRMERDVTKLEQLYQIGRNIATSRLNDLKEYLEIKE